MNFKLYQIFFLLLIPLFFIISCLSSQNLTRKPEWVLNQPINPNYYIGIGSVTKSSNINNYQQIAKKNALDDLAGQISINISNSSLLYNLSINGVYKETFDSRINSSTNEELEGYELVDTYEDHNIYWVYYKLSKQKYQQIKQQRIQKAIDNALSKFDKANSFKFQHKYYDALVLYIKSIEDIKQYLSEPLTTIYHDKEIYFGNELFNNILLCLNEIKINIANSKLSVKRGQSVNEDLLTFSIKDIDGNKIENIPIIADFTGCSLINDKSRSSILGDASFTIPKIKSKNNIDYFTASIDINTILQESTNDFLIKKMLKNIKTSEAKVQINISNPVFYIKSIEKKFNDTTANLTILRKCCESTFTSLNIDITNNIAEADFILEMNCNTNQSNIINNMYNVMLEGLVSVKNKESKTLYQRNITNIKGTQLSYDNAIIEAYNNANDYIKKRIIPEILEQLY